MTGIQCWRSFVRSTRPLGFAGLYFVFSCLWIFLSDKILGRFSLSPEAAIHWSIVKGFVYVAITSSLIYTVLNRLKQTNEHLEEVVASRTAALVASEKILRSNQEWLALAQQAGRSGAWEYEICNDVESWSAEVKALYGLTPDEPIECNADWESFVLPEDLETARAAIDRSLETGEYQSEFRIRRRDNGQVRWMHTRGRVVFDRDHQPLRMIGVNQDITESKQSELELQRTREMLEAFIDHAPVGIAMFDRNMCYVRCSRKWRAVAGLTDSRLAGKCHYDIFPILPTTWVDGYRRGLAGETVQGEDDWVMPDGRSCRCRWEVHPWGDSGAESGGIIVLFEDVTEARKIEAQLRQAQKMEAVGQLAGGVAHEYNNALCIILGNIELSMAEVEPDSRVISRLDGIRKAATRASAITRHLLAFSRKQVLHPQTILVCRFLEDTVAHLRPFIRENIRVEIRCRTNEAMVRFDSMQLEQVLINLVTNACDAMPYGGTLTIEAGLVDRSPRNPHGSSGSYVVLSVTDSGAGISPDDLPHIFEPFFTTKGVGKGTGLGLAITYGIVTQGGGEIEVDSSLGRGSRFDLFLPLHMGQTKPAQAPSTNSSVKPGFPATILLVEDESQVLEMIQSVLETNGYVVLPASDGEAALRLAETHPGSICLLLTDVILKGTLNGVAVARRLAVLRPEMRVLYMSGYSDALVAEGEQICAEDTLLRKPFRIEDLQYKVHSLVAG